MKLYQKMIMIALMGPLLLGNLFQAQAAAVITANANAPALASLLAPTLTPTAATLVAKAGVQQTGSVNAGLLGTVNAVPLSIVAPGVMLTTGDINAAGNSLQPAPQFPFPGDTNVFNALQPPYATTGTYDASSLSFTVTVPAAGGFNGIELDLIFATNEAIGGLNPDAAVVMVDGVNKAVFSTAALAGQLLANQTPFLFAAPAVISNYANVSELQTLSVMAAPGVHTISIAIADNTSDVNDSAIIVSNMRAITWGQDGMGGAAVDFLPPVVTVSPDVVMEATGPTTVATLGIATAIDNPGVALVPVPAPANPYPLGITPVTWSATDLAGNIGTAIQNVTINDTTPPAFTLLPANITFAATSALGLPSADPAVAAWLATPVATDLVTLAPVITNDAPPNLPIGQTTVTFTATDAIGNFVTTTAIVTVSNLTAPVLTLPVNLTVDPTSAAGVASSAFVIGNWLNAASAIDIVDGVVSPLIVNNAPALFPAGSTTTVTFQVTNSGGVTTLGQATVTVNTWPAPPAPASADRIPPIIHINGSDIVTVLQLDPLNPAIPVYADAGAIARDNFDGTLTAAIVTTNTVNQNVPGIYYVSYQVQDLAGNVTQAVRAVRVVASVLGLDVEPPVVTAPADLVVTASNYRGVSRNDPRLALFFTQNVAGGVSAIDNIGVLSITHDAPALIPVGRTVVTFTARDATGNAGTDKAVITVSGTSFGDPVYDTTVDSDQDGIPDTKEVALFGDLITFSLAIPDTDADGIRDSWEVAVWGNILTASNLTDFDGDGLLDIDELNLGTNPKVANSNATTLPNDFGDSVFPTSPSDTDGDGVIDALENAADMLNQSVASGIPGNNNRLKYSINAGANSISNVAVGPVNLKQAPFTIRSEYGTLGYNIHCTPGATVKLTLRSSLPFPPATPQFYKISAAGKYTVIPIQYFKIVNGSTVTFTLKDGGPLDIDGLANGVIVDPIAVGDAPQILGGASTSQLPGGGGCTISSKPDFDPTLVIMALLSLLYLGRRRFAHTG